jgi:hypothetical protein
VWSTSNHGRYAVDPVAAAARLNGRRGLVLRREDGQAGCCGRVADTALRPNGAVIAKGMDVDVEISADNLTDLRERLVKELKPFGYAPTLVGIRNAPETPGA